VTKIKLGDIFQINTPKGKAYLHYIYKDKELGDLIRVLPELYSEWPESLEQLARSKEAFMIFFPLSAANRKKIVEQVGYYPADNFGKPEYMRDKHIVRGAFLGWHIIDTKTWKRQLVNDLTSDQKRLSPWGIWNDTLLIERLVSDWSLEKWR
jgi:hypothetical protein